MRIVATGLAGLALAAAAVGASSSRAHEAGSETAAHPPAQVSPEGNGDQGSVLPVEPVDYEWPLSPEPEVVRGFQPPTEPWGPGHRGVDLGAPRGEPVQAAASGTVAFAGRVVDRTVVSIDHADGIRTTYEPLEPAVSTGDQVQVGEVIGFLDRGDTGAHCAADCLHWGARTTAGTYLDPLLLLGVEPPVIRLYPAG